MTGLSRATVTRKIDDGILRTIKIGLRRLILAKTPTAIRGGKSRVLDSTPHFALPTKIMEKIPKSLPVPKSPSALQLCCTALYAKSVLEADFLGPPPKDFSDE
jgi:hypothetical protein